MNTDKKHHKCSVCGAIWEQLENHFLLLSEKCGDCCDNSEYFLDVIEPYHGPFPIRVNPCSSVV
jgi:hypothetical protein